MRNIITIFKREFNGYFATPVAFVVIVIFLLLSMFFTFNMGNQFFPPQGAPGEASLGNFFYWHPWLYLFLGPAIGMRMWSEERRSGTIELLLTMPITPWQAIVGKFLATWAVIAVALVFTFPLIITVNYLGSPDNGVIFAGYLGTLLMAGCYVAISELTSAMTRNQVISFIIAAVICLLLVLLGFQPVTKMFETWAAPWFMEGLAGFSFYTHFESIQKGVLDSRDILYFLSVIGFCLYSTSIVIRAHRAG